MIMTIVPGSVTVAAGTATWASTFATATAVPGSRPVQAGGLGGQAAGPLADLAQVAAHPGVDDVGEAGDRGRRSRPCRGSRRASTTSPCSRPCTRCASRPRSAARRSSRSPRAGGPRRRRPPAPRRGSAAPWRRTTPTRSCRRSGPARPAPVARATSLIRSASGCAAWCFQSLTQACGFERIGREHRQRGAVGRRREHRAGRQVDADADDVGRVDRGLADDRRDGGLAGRRGSRRRPGAPSRAAGRTSSSGAGSRSSMTPLRYGVTAVASCRPSATSTSTARPDSVPKSTPIAYRLTAAPLDSWRAIRPIGGPVDRRPLVPSLDVRYRSR